MKLFFWIIVLLGMLCSPKAGAGEPLGDAVSLKLYNKAGQQVLNDALTSSTFWDDAWNKRYEGKLYDEMRMKSIEAGYIPMITGEGDVDFDQDVVQHIVFKRLTRLPTYMSGARAVVPLGSGWDTTHNVEYQDVYMYLDLTLFYCVFPQRMYRVKDASGRHVIYYELITEDMVDAATWASYSAKIQSTNDTIKRRWPPFNAMVPPSEVYGMFVVGPGETRKTRVTYVTKLIFGEDAGFIARWGSEMPSVLKAGLKSGFEASVAIAKEEEARRAKN